MDEVFVKIDLTIKNILPNDIVTKRSDRFVVIVVIVGGKVPLGLKGKSKRILVTGGAGFVGSHLVDRLIARGDSVIVVDNFFTGKKENLLHHFKNPRFELIRHDVVEPILLEVDQIYHLACPASPVHYKFNPVKTIISLISHSLYHCTTILLTICVNYTNMFFFHIYIVQIENNNDTYRVFHMIMFVFLSLFSLTLKWKDITKQM